MHKLIEEILNSNEVETPSGKRIPLHSAIDRDQGALLLDLFKRDPSIQKTLEVGCAYGLSSLFIAEGLRARPHAHHTIIDPYQNAHWEGVGISNLEKAGFAAFELIEEKSEFALPAILKDREGSFDLVFIDGWHTFDHTLLDCFYATRLLRIGGYLVVDDVSLPAIRRVMDYLLLYPCFTLESAALIERRANLKKQIARFLVRMVPHGIGKRVFRRSLLNPVNDQEGMVALKKVAADDRRWNWYSGDF